MNPGRDYFDGCERSAASGRNVAEFGDLYVLNELVKLFEQQAMNTRIFVTSVHFTAKAVRPFGR